MVTWHFQVAGAVRWSKGSPGIRKSFLLPEAALLSRVETEKLLRHCEARIVRCTLNNGEGLEGLWWAGLGNARKARDRACPNETAPATHTANSRLTFSSLGRTNEQIIIEWKSDLIKKPREAAADGRPGVSGVCTIHGSITARAAAPASSPRIWPSVCALP